MKRDIRIAAPPEKPVLIYDGECRFCALWIKRWQQSTGDQVDYIPFQDSIVAARFPEIPVSWSEQSVHLVEPDGSVYGGAQAALRSLARNPARGWLLSTYEKIPAFAGMAEWVYRLVARNRTFFSLLTRIGWGNCVEQPSYQFMRELFLRALGIVYLCAFVSLMVQVAGLIGSTGIFPASETIKMVQEQAEQQNIGWERYRLFPTLCWWTTSDAFLQYQCAAGIAFSILLIVGIAPPLCLFLLWLLYLSLTTISIDFLSFQWDNLLLETGFLAIFLGPMRVFPKLSTGPPSRVVIWLLRWLLFRLMFESGCVKLLSGDATWRNFTALDFHYETQPLPTWLGWHAHQLPDIIQQGSLLMMFAIELVLPFFIFGPRRCRATAALIFILLEAMIAFTGNYGFFNLLTIVLCLPLLDDFTVSRWLPRTWCERMRATVPVGPAIPSNPVWRRVRTMTLTSLAAVVLLVTTIQLVLMFDRQISPPRWIMVLHSWSSPFRSLNQYGLFAVMTTSRNEIVVEGSNDGKTWVPYEFKHKPGDPSRRPGFIAPHLPRLDWQMWFAALGDYQQNPWFMNFQARLLQGSPEVIALLKNNPFPEKPPKQIRAVLYRYQFTNGETRVRTGEWWKRERKNLYSPALQL